ncbi:MAG: glycine/sarcosine/betaine reductase selenoprotein B family protein [Pseudomonadota bacterium]
MVRLSDLPEYEREHLLDKNGPPLGPPRFHRSDKPLGDMRVALITTAGLHFRDDAAFHVVDSGFRPIPAEADTGDLVMSHSSVNFDKSGFAADVELVLPLRRLHELAAQGVVGSVADLHFSFMGAGLEPAAYADSAAQVAGLLQADAVDAVFLTPV